MLGEIRKLEREALDRDQDILNIEVSKTNIEEISQLLGEGYEVVGVSEEYTLSKKLNDRKTFRVSLTEECNYRCFFCHEEGMEMTKRESKNFEDIYNLCLRALESGYKDITFTGGEPLIKMKWVKDMIKLFNDRMDSPELTIVTNGVLIDDELIDLVSSYKGKFKFNVSMHHLDKEKYFEIVKPKGIENPGYKRDDYEVVVKNIKKITKKNINLKMNFVILKGINSDKKDLIEILEFAKENNVNNIKFLEFLVTDKLLNYYNYYFTLDSIYEELKDKLKLVDKNLRTKYYKYGDSDVIVELSHCPCALGCSKCILVNGVIATAELKYYPCFFRSKENYSLDDDFKENVFKGREVIKALGNKFGDKTPFKVSSGNYVDKKVEYLYYLDEDTDFLNDYHLDRTRKFEERIYGVNNGQVKLFKDSYRNKYIEVVKKYERIGNKVESTFVFGKEKRTVDDLEKYEKYIEVIGGKLVDTLEWEIEYYIGKENLSISKTKMGKRYIVSSKPLKIEGVKELHSTIEEDILKCKI